MKNNTKSPEISVVIPVYNVAQYLERCVNSLLEQTFKDFELILVDDGSTDDSPKICDKLKLRDSRIITIHKINGGLSSARNSGLEMAKGQFLMFVDSDDLIVDNRTLEVCLSVIREDHELDFVEFRHQSFSDNPYKIVPDEIEPKIIESSKNIFESIFVQKNLQGYAWGKLFRMSTIKNMRYRNGISLVEDALFFLDYSDHFRKAKVINAGLYGYYQRPNSLSRSWNKESAHYLCIMRQLLYKKLVTYDYDEAQCGIAWVDAFMALADSIALNGIIKDYKRYIKTLTRDMPDNKVILAVPKKQYKWFRLANLIGVSNSVKLYSMLTRIHLMMYH